MNKVIIGIVASLITLFIAWLSYTVYENAKNLTLIEYQMGELNKAVQRLSEGE